MVRKREKVKLSIDVSLEELEGIEDFHSTILLCKKHKGVEFNEGKGYSERRLMTMYYECKDCEKVYKKARKATQSIEGRLFKEYFKKYPDV